MLDFAQTATIVAVWEGPTPFVAKNNQKKTIYMNKAENNIVRERPAESLPNAAMAEQIQRALDVMRRLRAVNAEQAERALQESAGNKYVLPDPVVFHVSTAS